MELNYGSWVTRACATPPVVVNRDLLASVSGTGAFGVGSSFVEFQITVKYKTRSIASN